MQFKNISDIIEYYSQNPELRVDIDTSIGDKEELKECELVYG